MSVEKDNHKDEQNKKNNDDEHGLQKASVKHVDRAGQSFIDFIFGDAVVASWLI